MFPFEKEANYENCSIKLIQIHRNAAKMLPKIVNIDNKGTSFILITTIVAIFEHLKAIKLIHIHSFELVVKSFLLVPFFWHGYRVEFCERRMGNNKD